VKVLLKVCQNCGFLQFFSISVLCRPQAPDTIGVHCPSCGKLQSVAGLATEIDQPEYQPIDEAAVARAIERFL
jgi:hypothetical protein